jgi:hypothetical protein
VYEALLRRCFDPAPSRKRKSNPLRDQGDNMGVVSLPHSVDYPQGHIESRQSETEWIRTAVGGTVLLGSLLILTGKRRAGLVVTAAGAALALLEEENAIRTLWNSLPQYLDDAQRLLDQAQQTVDNLASKREKLRSMFGR